VTPSVLVIDRSAVGVRVSESAAELLAGADSAMPPAAATVAVLTNVPVADADTVAVTVNVTDVPTGRPTVALMLPLPLAGHVPPPVPVHVHVAPVRAAGNVSVTVEPGAADGPALDATIVYVTDVPGTFDVTPSVLVIDRSTVGVNASVSVAELFAAVGSVTVTGAAIVAVLTRLPVAVAAIVPVTVKAAVAPTGRSTDALMLPLPLAGQVPPPAAVQVHVGEVMAAGIVSATVAAVTVDGPAFDATIVYVTDVPGTLEVTPSVLVIDRSAVGTNVSVSVAVLLAGVGSVVPPGRATLAVLASVPVAVAEMMPVSANVAVPPASNETVALIAPEPDAGHDDPADAAHVHVAPVIVAGTVSVTVPPVTTDGPELEATIV